MYYEVYRMTNRDEQGQYQSSVSEQAILSFFTESERPYQTARDVGDRFDLDRSTAYRRLQRLADEGQLRKDEVGARAVVWWMPAEVRAEHEVTA
jgi:DNA-binding IclR family transcriptional regulator